MRLPTLRHVFTRFSAVGLILVLGIGALALWSVLTPAGKRATPTAKAPEPGRCPNETASPGEASLGTWTKATICLLNAERVDHGLRPLTVARPLARAGRHHASSMDSADYFS